jgi:hypothetical protein
MSHPRHRTSTPLFCLSILLQRLPSLRSCCTRKNASFQLRQAHMTRNLSRSKPSVGTTLPKTSSGIDDHAELSPAKRQKIIHDILSVPFPETDGEESNSCFLETATDLFELFFTLGAIYFTFHIYRSVHSQGFQTESNTSQGRPTIRRFKLASLEDWERHKKLLQELHTEYRQTKLRLEDLSDGQMWDFYWVWRETPGGPKRLECFWAEPASL